MGCNSMLEGIAAEGYIFAQVQSPVSMHWLCARVGFLAVDLHLIGGHILGNRGIRQRMHLQRKASIRNGWLTLQLF